MTADIAVPAILFLAMVILHILRTRELNPLVQIARGEYDLGAAATLGNRKFNKIISA